MRLITPASGALFAATEEELFRSDDGGLTWAVVPRPPETTVSAVSPVNHDLLYAAGPVGVHRSDDGGATWQRISGQAGAWSQLEVSPADPNILYGDASIESVASGVTTIRHERRVSHDAGLTWEVTNTHDERRLSGLPMRLLRLRVRAPRHEQRAPADDRGLHGARRPGRPDELRRRTHLGGVPRGEHARMVVQRLGRRAGGGSRPLVRLAVPLQRALHPGLPLEAVRTDDDGASWTTVFEEDSGEPYSKTRKAVDFVGKLTYDPRRPDYVFAVFERYEPNADRYKETDPVAPPCG